MDDTDLSFDGDRSDASSTIRGCTNLRDPRVYNIMDEGHCKMAKATSVPPETDGVVLPWLQWETSNDCSPSPCKTNGTTGLVIDSTKIKVIENTYLVFSLHFFYLDLYLLNYVQHPLHLPFFRRNPCLLFCQHHALFVACLLWPILVTGWLLPALLS